MKKYVLKIVFLGILLGFLYPIQVSASVNQDNTETKKVEVGKDVVIANTSKYVDRNHAQMVAEASENECAKDCKLKFTTVNEMKQSSALKCGMVVLTETYGKEDTQGGSYYKIVNEKGKGNILLDNGLYAEPQLASYVDNEGVTWLVANVHQFGAVGNGSQEDHEAINNAISYVGETVANNKQYARGLIYIPEGEYKCGNQIHVGYSNLNIVGDGEKTILFTDNDYRDKEGYSEFFFQCWGANNMYIASFRIEAREVDLYRYMRQFVLLYSTDVYVYQVDMIIPQESYNSYYFEDKQYSNFCCYSGNKNITVNECRMEQMSGTYRGANLGVLDIWAAGEENITIMNCDMYGNARDEQIGFFSKNDGNAFVKHVNFLNNTVHSTEIKYPDIIGTRTMCFTIAYSDSQNIEDIYIAGNHFICETDSKFMTFGKMKNCVIEKNIMEIKCTHKTWSLLFDSACESAEDVLITENQIYMTSNQGYGRGNIGGGNVTLQGNTIFSDVNLAFGVLGPEIHGNKIVFLKNMGKLCSDANCTGNSVYLYNGLGSSGVTRKQIATYGSNEKKDYLFANNTIYNYLRSDQVDMYQSLFLLNGGIKSLKIDNNRFYYPNVRYTFNQLSSATKYTDEKGTFYKNAFFRMRSGTYDKIVVTNNEAQGVEMPSSDTVFDCKNNKEIAQEENLDEKLCSSVEILYKGKKVEEITTDQSKIDLEDVEYIAKEVDADGKVVSQEAIDGKEIRWYTSVEDIASVSEDGIVTKHLNGDVKVYAVPLDGSGVYGSCLVHFETSKSEKIVFSEKEITLQPELKYYMDYEVEPASASQTLKWSSSDESVASIDQNGTITAHACGDAIITGTTIDTGIRKSIKVTVSSLTVKKIDLNEKYMYSECSKIGTTVQFSVASYTPDNAQNKGISKWTSSNENVVTIDKNGLATIVGSGYSEIRGYSMDEACYGVCRFAVQPPKVENLSAWEYTNEYISLSWNQVDSATGYYIYQWDDQKSEWVKIGTQTKNYYKVSKLMPNTKYRFSVRAYLQSWNYGKEMLHESEANEIEVKTLSYVPVTSINCNKSITLTKGESREYGVSYAPDTANFKGLKLEALSDDSSIVSIVSMDSSGNAKYTLKLKGENYGLTNLKITSNDELGKKIVIPVGVTTGKKVPDGMEITGTAIKTSITFSAMENEAEEVANGSITGYMVRRTNSVEYSDVGYVEARGLSSYTYVDTTVKEGTKYSYRVYPCLSDGENFYVGYGNKAVSFETPAMIDTTSIVTEKDIYTVTKGSKEKIIASLLPEGTTSNGLSWSSDNEQIVMVKRMEDAGNDATESAEVYGKKVGATTIHIETTDGTFLSAQPTVVVVPDEIQEVEGIATNKQVKLSWKAQNDVTGYKVHRYDEQKKTWVQISKVVDSVYIDQDLKCNTQYMYRVTGYYTYDGIEYDGVSSESLSVKTLHDIFSSSTGSAIDVTTGSSTGTVGNTEKIGNKVFDDKNNIRITGYNKIYDGLAHPAVMVENSSMTDQVLFSIDGKTWERTVPTVTNVWDSKMIYVRIIRNGTNFDYKVNSVILACSISDCPISLVNYVKLWDGRIFEPEFLLPDGMSLQDITVFYDTLQSQVGKHKVAVRGNGNYCGTKEFEYKIKLDVGKTYLMNGYKYKYLGNNKVEVKGITKDKKNIVIRDFVILGEKRICKVTSIGASAFKGKKKVSTVTIGKNVVHIKKLAFANNKNLKKVVFKGTQITKIDKTAWKRVSKKIKYYIPKQVRKNYQKLLPTHAFCR